MGTPDIYCVLVQAVSSDLKPRILELDAQPTLLPSIQEAGGFVGQHFSANKESSAREGLGGCQAVKKRFRQNVQEALAGFCSLK